MSVFRRNPLPVGKSRGRLIVGAAVAAVTQTALKEFRGPDGRHEGLVYWAGHRADGETIVLAALVPESDHGPGHVFISEREVGRMSRQARALGLVILAQVHSHPGDDTRHSDGDDYLVLMPFENMFSLVVAHYGDGGLRPSEGSGLHQYQQGRWTWLNRGPVEPLIIVPPMLVIPS